MTFFEYIMTVLAEFGGGRGPASELVRFALAAIFFAVLLGVALARQRKRDLPRETLLIWGFGVGLLREAFMFGIVSATITGLINPVDLERFFPPAEHTGRNLAVILIAGAFVRFLLDDAAVARRYLRIWISATILCYLVTFWPWAQAVASTPGIKFGMHWADWAFHILGVAAFGAAILLLLRTHGWVRNVALVALGAFLLDDLLMLFNLGTGEVYGPIYAAIRHNLHLWAIPLLGYVYFREQANELQAAQATLQAYSDQLEEMVATRTAQLQERTERLEQQTAELERAKDAAEVASRAKSDFLSNMNHELRSPLNAILGFTRITARYDTLPVEAQENLSIVLRSGEHLLTLINQVLDLAKIESGHTRLNEGVFDLHYLIETIEDMFVLSAETKGLQLIVESAPTLPRGIVADEIKLRQVLINLMSNALKFTDQGSVTLRIENVPLPDHANTNANGNLGGLATINVPHDARARRLRFTVVDTGPGIPAEDHDHVFESFAQSTLGQQHESSTGLGLPISRAFVEVMGGTLTLQSPVPAAQRGPNALPDHPGALFTFEIDVVAVAGHEHVAAETRREDRITGLAPGQPEYRILVVDDKAVNRQLLLKLLTPIGFTVREATNGQEALAIWQEWQPHLIWMDMRMPVLDGYQATMRIKATTQGQATVIIALTASAFEEERAIVLSTGCDDFLRKPFREADIFAMMAQHLGVRYALATTDATPSATPHLSEQAIINALRALPLALLTDLQHAVALSDIEELESVITRIAHNDPPIATALSIYARDYDFAQLEQYLEQAG